MRRDGRSAGVFGGRAGPPWRATLAWALLLPLVAGAIGAADFTVATVADGPDAVPGDGLCATAAAVCTLRAAVMEANAVAGPDRVLLGARTYVLTLVGSGDAAGDLDLTSDLEVAGTSGTRVSAVPGVDRLLEVSAGIATVHDVTLQALGSVANPSCLLATAPLVAINVLCEPSFLSESFESGDLSAWSASFP